MLCNFWNNIWEELLHTEYLPMPQTLSRVFCKGYFISSLHQSCEVDCSREEKKRGYKSLQCQNIHSPHCLPHAISEGPRNSKIPSKAGWWKTISQNDGKDQNFYKVPTFSQSWLHLHGLNQRMLELVVSAPHWGQQNCKSSTALFWMPLNSKPAFWATVKVT